MPEVPDSTFDRAESIRANLAAGAENLRADNDLTDEAKRQRISDLYATAKTHMADLEQSFQSSTTQTAKMTLRDVFGATSTAGADAISVRDADDRASRIESPREAADLLARAEQNGDAVLSRAVALKAYQEANNFLGGSAWEPALQTYVDAHPDVVSKLEQYQQASKTNVSTRSMFAFVVSPPKELETRRSFT